MEPKSAPGVFHLLNRALQVGLTRAAFVCCFLAFSAAIVRAQDRPYFVTYSHDMEEPGEMAIESKTALASPDHGNPFGATVAELEYGVRAWWTFGLYLDGQVTDEESAILGGFRLENRLRPLRGEHTVNPVMYVEFENISGADKAFLEVVGHDTQSYMATPNRISQREHKHAGELKLILSSNLRTWNISENFIAEKNLGHAPWEFGYAVGVTRPLRNSSTTSSCTFCVEKLVAGVEGYGGLGDTAKLSLHETSHYLSPLIGWQLSKALRVSFSSGFGLTANSLDRIYRVGLAYDFPRSGIRVRAAAEHLLP
jgi:hypothetical protein